MTRAVVVAWFLAFAVPAVAQTPGVSRAFDDWAVVCDNTRVCAAIGFPEDGGTAGDALVITRQPGPNGAITLGFTFGDGPPTGAGRLDVVADGRLVARLAPATDIRVTPPDAAPGDPVILTLAPAASAARDAILAALRTDEVLVVQRDGVPDPVATISLRGASASLLLIDDLQGRVGTTTALVRRGTRAASTVPAGVPPPVAPADRAIPAIGDLRGPPPGVVALLRSEPRDTCTLDDPDIAAARGTESYRLGEGVTLHVVPCWRGPYNSTQALYVERGGRVDRMAPPQAIAPHRGDREALATRHVLFNTMIDPARGTLTSDAKGRGLSDCGERATWAWDGAAFVVVAAKAMPLCRGLVDDLWPSAYRTRPRAP